MTSRRLDTVDVYADLSHLDGPAPMGSLRCQTSRSRDILSFQHHPWVQNHEALPLDPDLSLGSGPQYPVAGRATFGIFLDSSPDRWGSVVMQRRENMRARREERRARSLTEWD